MSPANKQDVQAIVETAKNRIMERVALRQDMQFVTDNVKTLITITQQNQQYLRNAEYQRSQLTRRVIALETRLAQLEQEIRGYKGTLNRVADTRPQQIIVPAPAEPQPAEYTGQYVYRPG